MALHDFANRGIKISGVELDLAVMMKNKEKAVDQLTKGIEMLFKMNKVDYVKGHGTLTSGTSLSVALNDGGVQTIGGVGIDAEVAKQFMVMLKKQGLKFKM